MFGKIATPPNGTVFILIILVVLALFFGNHYSICTEDMVISKQNIFSGWIFSLIRLPPLLGMLLTGIMIKNLPELYIEDWKFDQYWVKSSGILRGTALVVILMRAGLGLDPKALKRLSGK